MSRIDKIKKEVEKLYGSKNSSRDDWADWLFEKHVFAVADEAERLADKMKIEKDFSVAAGMLHDIADAVMSRFNPEHKEKSFEIAKEILRRSDFSEEEIDVIVDDILKFHSCRKGENPKTKEGKIMATADAIVHIKTDFYKTAIELMKKEGRDSAKIKNWALLKLERDFNDKILFDEVQEELRPDYEKLREFLIDHFR